ncbi:MAG TPA: mobile mystery protein B [Desulfobacteraceae bacterium]|nr:mobile mystery protein B [Desulfobacteraceae bacterium]
MIKYDKNATPLEPDELKGLKLSHITTRQQLDFWEAHNISEARIWIKGIRHKDILTPEFLCTLHRKMFSDVWKWAGKYRNTEKNLGVLPHLIETQVYALCEEANGWLEYESYSPDEVVARFHHRLVAIHPFPNGNGRHARFIADLILEKIFEKAPFSWGGKNLAAPSEIRQAYIQALKAADDHDYSLLLAFVRS